MTWLLGANPFQIESVMRVLVHVPQNTRLVWSKHKATIHYVFEGARNCRIEDVQKQQIEGVPYTSVSD